MAVLPILRFGNPILRQKSKRISSIDGSIQKLIDDMIETMRDANGAGLAAPQIGKLLRVIVIGLPGEEPFALINPQIMKKSGEREVVEGCLCFPGYRGKMKRAVSITAKGRDRHGKEVRLKAEDLLAQTLEHEIDHLHGVLYIDHLQGEDSLYRIHQGETP
ncbi:MAG: Peptide deformylase 1 [Chloroflexi bacterium]|nr:Peptide deformylase 1 [Chloroflexota bacterium]MBT9166578.1 Peptide deformylase 1 [Chloroflexota bacterium]